MFSTSLLKLGSTGCIAAMHVAYLLFVYCNFPVKQAFLETEPGRRSTTEEYMMRYQAFARDELNRALDKHQSLMQSVGKGLPPLDFSRMQICCYASRKSACVLICCDAYQSQLLQRIASHVACQRMQEKRHSPSGQKTSKTSSSHLLTHCWQGKSLMRQSGALRQPLTCTSFILCLALSQPAANHLWPGQEDRTAHI